MGFSTEWDTAYKAGTQLSIWPWTKLVSLVHHYAKLHEGIKVLEIGCGAGANISFFQAIGADYYAIEGSKAIVDKLQEKYKVENVHIVQGDFTKTLGFDTIEKFDIIVDRSALTHNSTEDIKAVLQMIHERLADNGVFIGVDWHSDKQTASKEKGVAVDEYTKVFSEGYYNGLGRTHFSNEKHLRDLLKNFKIKLLEEIVTTTYEPNTREIAGAWNFVVSK